jgi:hypothetical protein
MTKNGGKVAKFAIFFELALSGLFSLESGDFCSTGREAS